jgi:hypothetical protein
MTKFLKDMSQVFRKTPPMEVPQHSEKLSSL